MCGEQRQVCTDLDLAPWCGKNHLVKVKNHLVKVKIVVKRDPVRWNGVEKDSYSNRHLNGDYDSHGRESELQ